MRCPYCNGQNPDQNIYCTYCGRDMRISGRPAAGSQYPPVQPPRPVPQSRPPSPPQAPSRPPQPAQQPLPMPPGQPGQPARQAQQGGAAVSTQARPQAPRATSAPPVPVAPDPPAPFPPRTLAELQALEQGALAYTVLDSEMGVGRKKNVRIIYPRATAWQQVATLFKALKEQQDEQFERIIIQGQVDQRGSVYAFTNGQLCFDRNVRLGASVTNRYQIETGNGFENDSVRIVLNA